jgi:hypothetical protein
MQKMRIFIGLKEIAGHYFYLQKGFNELGIETRFYDLYCHPFKYGQSKEKNIIVRLNQFIHTRIARSNKSKISLKYVLLNGLLLLSRSLLFLIAIIRYDVFILGFDSSFFFYYDLPILKFFNKKIIYRFHGADCRPPYLSGGYLSLNNHFNAEKCVVATDKKKAFIRKVEKHSDNIISNPLFSHFLEKPFINATYIGLPIHIDQCGCKRAKEKHEDSRIKERIVILHAPSNPKVKGSSTIKQEINSLIKLGYQIEFRELEKLPNEEVLKQINNSDLIVDQLYSETPMAGFSTEAAFFAKPAIVCGYAKKWFNEIYPPGKIPPTVYCHPDNFLETLQFVINNMSYVKEVGIEAKKFIDNNWTPKLVAQKYLQIINNEIPKEWYYYPGDIVYVHGAGMTEKKVKSVIRSLIERKGKKALNVDEKPNLQNMLVAFAYSDNSH